jgi:hypothetical protein
MRKPSLPLGGEVVTLRAAVIGPIRNKPGPLIFKGLFRAEDTRKRRAGPQLSCLA